MFSVKEFSLKDTVSIVLVTHNIAQAGRVSDFAAFLYMGELIEFGPSGKMFAAPKDQRTEEYLTGKFGWNRNRSLDGYLPLPGKSERSEERVRPLCLLYP